MSEAMVIKGEQIRAARAMLRLEQTALAEKAGVSVETVKRLETFDGEPKAQYGTLLAVREALELCGLDFDGDGVRRAADRNSRMIDMAATEIDGFVRSGLKLQAKRDPKFFERGSRHVADALYQLLSPALLEKLVTRAIPGELQKLRKKIKGDDA